MTLLDGLDKDAFYETLHNARQRLLDERNEHGWWTGELSSSALSTATAIAALSLVDRAKGENKHADTIQHAISWLLDNQNDDGGWGDTDKSFSNISTTMLCWAALGDFGNFGSRMADRGLKDTQSPQGDHGAPLHPNPKSEIRNPKSQAALAACEHWLTQHAGSLNIPDLVEAVMKRYGKDRTFSVPILTMCALCGRLGDPQDRATWKWVKQLPFELAALPQSWFNKVNLQVVSYALPALIAIGQVRHHHRPTRNPITRLFRKLAKKRTLRRLETIQPPNGGFLEATPLTSFVTMSLAACGLARNPVAIKGVDFITNSMRDNGSWPIDTNLATWVTTLSVNALAAGGKLDEHLNEPERNNIRDWLLGQQYTEVHPYTGAAPGGWSWTDLPGGVPDADDTSGAVLAVWHLEPDIRNHPDAPWARRMFTKQELATMQDEPSPASAGLYWLRTLTNRDGGIPTFCRGWGRLPFDKSSVDITAHYARAEFAECPQFWPMGSSVRKFVEDAQKDDGSWLPLWFGNQHVTHKSNPTYGTSRVLLSLYSTSCKADWRNLINTFGVRGLDWLMKQQSADGGWGGNIDTPASIEETGLALEALVAAQSCAAKPQTADQAITCGVEWLIQHTQRGTHFPPSPIGFYFAKLWYYEKLYPIIYTVAALERVAALIESEST